MQPELNLMVLRKFSVISKFSKIFLLAKNFTLSFLPGLRPREEIDSQMLIISGILEILTMWCMLFFFHSLKNWMKP